MYRSMYIMLLVALFATPLTAFASSQTYAVPGSYAFTVPAYGTLTVEVWGGGQHNDLWTIFGDTWDAYGTASSFNGTLVAGGGGGGNIGDHPVDGGSASGGDVNVKGNPGIWRGGFWASGGNAPYGGIGGFNPDQSATSDWHGRSPGGGGGCNGGSFIAGCIGGGSGGYVKKTYQAGDLTTGASIPVVVGAGGYNANNWGGGNGGNGEVKVTWDEGSTSTPAGLSCTLATSPTSVTNGQNTAVIWSSTGDPNDFYISSIGDVADSGTTTISPTRTTEYSGAVYACPSGSTLSGDRSQCLVGNATGNAGSQTYAVPGSYAFTVPTYGTLTVEVWGGGQHNDLWTIFGDTWDAYGTASSFNGTLVAGGGGGGNIGDHPVDGGSASGGDVNVKGNPGIWRGGFWASGGNAPYGGIGGFNPDQSATSDWHGRSPGGGGGCNGGSFIAGCIGGGSGGYVKKTYQAGDLTTGASIPVVVGAGGYNANNWGGGNGGNGEVKVTWTASGTSSVAPRTATCSATVTVSGSCVGGQIFTDTGCTCPSEQRWDATQQLCVDRCPAGQEWSALVDRCVAVVPCPDGRSPLNGMCQCSMGETWNGTRCVAVACPVGSVLDGSGSCTCSDGMAVTGGSCSGSILDLTVQPLLVVQGATVNVSWNTAHMSVCSVTNNAGALTWTGLTGASKVSAPITGRTIFTLSCVDLLGVPLTASKTVNIVPTFNER